MEAVAYLRWSTLEQGNNDKSSEERQRLAVAAFIERHGWTGDTVLIDSGKSAYTGANLTKGELGRFSKRVASGAIDARTTVLVVEELDRLSRRPPGEMTAWMMPLLMQGLTIAIASTGQIITADKVNNDFGSFVTLMSQGFSGFEFSRKQSSRGNGSWEKRRRVFIEEGKAIARHRGRKWLEWNAGTKEFLPIPDRVALVEEMFRLRLKGWGKASIAKSLNERGVTPWQSIEKAPTQWTTSAIARIVQDPAVTGYIQFHRNPRGAEKKTPIGEPVRVYPAVIDAETFARANDERLVQQLKTQGRGRSVSNLFGPLARCGDCGGVMQPLGSSRIRVNKNGTTSQHYPIYCQAAKMTKGAQCANQRGWPYRAIETPVLDILLPKALDDQFFRAGDDDVVRLEGQAAIMRRLIADQTKSAQRCLALVRDGDGDEDELALAAYDEARTRLKATKAGLDALMVEMTAAHGRTTPSGHVMRVSDVRAQMTDSDDETRFRLRTH